MATDNYHAMTGYCHSVSADSEFAELAVRWLIGGSKLLIEDGVNGFLVGVSDVEMLYQKMKYLAEHSEESNRMGLNAQKVRDKFAIDRIAQEWVDAFDTV